MNKTNDKIVIPKMTYEHRNMKQEIYFCDLYCKTFFYHDDISAYARIDLENLDVIYTEFIAWNEKTQKCERLNDVQMHFFKSCTQLAILEFKAFVEDFSDSDDKEKFWQAYRKGNLSFLENENEFYKDQRIQNIRAI